MKLHGYMNCSMFYAFLCVCLVSMDAAVMLDVWVKLNLYRRFSAICIHSGYFAECWAVGFFKLLPLIFQENLKLISDFNRQLAYLRHIYHTITIYKFQKRIQAKFIDFCNVISIHPLYVIIFSVFFFFATQVCVCEETHFNLKCVTFTLLCNMHK